MLELDLHEYNNGNGAGGGFEKTSYLVTTDCVSGLFLSPVGTGSDSDWVLSPLAIRTPVATALGTDKTKNPVAIAPGSDRMPPVIP